MRDLQQFGQRFRELRTGRGLTQDDVTKRSAAYGDVRSLRKLESGEVQPKRKVIIELLFEAIEERNSAVFDELLALAGYRALGDQEKSRLGFVVVELEPVPAMHSVPWRIRWMWRGTIIGGALVSVLVGWGVSGFDWLGSLMYASLFAVSLLLEAAHEFHGRETIEAAGAAAAFVLPLSLAALRLDNRGVGEQNAASLAYALSLIVLAACLQWVIARPALPSYTIVQTRFQSQTAQAAHLKNTGYFLLLAFVFWLPPHHCGEAARRHLQPAFCPPPLALWIALVCLMAGTVPMGSHLLDNLQPTANHNLYVNLFWIRALLFFALSAMSLLWYSIAGS
jgi:transcriptional regulator with XRE-family HTH domain